MEIEAAAVLGRRQKYHCIRYKEMQGSTFTALIDYINLFYLPHLSLDLFRNRYEIISNEFLLAT